MLAIDRTVVGTFNLTRGIGAYTLPEAKDRQSDANELVTLSVPKRWPTTRQSMHGARALLYIALVMLLAQSALAIDGAASKDELRQLYQHYFEQRDESKLGTLVYWRDVRLREHDSFFRSIRSDLNYRLQKVELVPLDPTFKMEYTLDGITFEPALPPVVRMVATYEGQGNVGHLSTSYLVGVKGGRYYIDMAVPAKRSRRRAD